MGDRWMERVDRLVEAVREDVKTPGVAVAVTNRNELAYEAFYGLSNLDAGTPVRGSDRFQFGSIGKSFTAILLLQLEAEGRIDLTGPVERYLPWFRVGGAPPIRLHHLLSHTSGLIGGTDFPPDARLEVWRLRDTDTVWEPGTRFHYSNLGFKTLGLVLQEVTGRSYAELVSDRVLAPLGMRETGAVITHDMRRCLATGYHELYDDRPYWPGEPLVVAPWIETDTADGCLSGTVADLARYVRLYLNGGVVNGRPLLPPGQHRRLLQPVVATGAEEWYALGLARTGAGPEPLIGHSGGMLGYFAHMEADFAAGLGVAVVVNGPGRPTFLARQILKLARAGLLGEALPDEESVAGTHLTDPARFAGTFTASGGDRIQLAAAGSALAATFNGERLDPPRALDDDTIQVHHRLLDRFVLERVERAGGTVALYHGGTTYWGEGGGGDAPSPDPALRPFEGHYRSHDPWQSNFRVRARGDRLYLMEAAGGSVRLEPVDKSAGVFRLTDDEGPLPETLTFGVVVGDGAQEARLAGCPYARFFTP